MQARTEMKTFLRMRASCNLFSVGASSDDLREDPEGGRFIQLLDDVRAALSSFPSLWCKFDVPCVVVIGDQSAGKSSFVQALTGVPLPKASTRCTMRPLEIQIRRPELLTDDSGEPGIESKSSDDDSPSAAGEFAEVVVKAAPRDQKERNAACRDLDVVDDDTATRELGEIIQKLNKAQSYDGSPIIVQVTMRDHIALTVIDLPGLVNESANVQLKDIYKPFLNNSNAIVVPVMSALNRDISTTHTAAHYVSADAMDTESVRPRMIGVITQLDTIGEHEHSVKAPFFELLQPNAPGNPFALPNGYYVAPCLAAVNGIFTSQGREFSSASEMDEYLKERWIAEYLNSNSPRFRLTRDQLQSRFGRAAVRQTLRRRLIQLSRNALARLPAAVQARIDELRAQLARHPTREELARRQEILAARFMSSLRDKVDDIRPSRTGRHQGLALVDGSKSLAELTAEWDAEMQQSINAIHVFLGTKLVERLPHAVEYFEDRYARDRRENDGYLPSARERLTEIAATSANIEKLVDRNMDRAREHSTATLVEWLSKRFKDDLAGFLDYSIFQSYVNAVLVTVMEPIIVYFRKYSCLCGYILNTLLWEFDCPPDRSRFSRLQDHLRTQFEAVFRKKLDDLVHAVKDEVSRAFRQRKDPSQAPMRVAYLPEHSESLKQAILIEIERAMHDCFERNPDGFNAPDLLAAQKWSVEQVFAARANQRPLELVERDVRAYLAVLERHWNNRRPLLIENLREMVNTHLLDSFLDSLREFELPRGDEDLVDDDASTIIPDIERIERELEALTRAQRLLGSAASAL